MLFQRIITKAPHYLSMIHIIVNISNYALKFSVVINRSVDSLKIRDPKYLFRYFARSTYHPGVSEIF